MEVRINIDDFDCEGCAIRDVMRNISFHCEYSTGEKISIYSGHELQTLNCYDYALRYPNVVYVENLRLVYNVEDLKSVFPDLKKIGSFVTNYNKIQDFGKIEEIDYFLYMSFYFVSDDRPKYNQITVCEPIGNKMYRFKTKKGTWDIKVNKYF